MNTLLIAAVICLFVLIVIITALGERARARNETRKFFAGRDAVTDREFCRLVGSELLDDRMCSAVRDAFGSLLRSDVEDLLQPEDRVRALLALPFDGADPVELFMCLEKGLGLPRRAGFSEKDMEWILNGEYPPESLTLGEFSIRLARDLKWRSEQRQTTMNP